MPDITSRNAAFQQWQALLTNRAKRTRTRQFVVQGVRPITIAIEHGWQIEVLVYPRGRQLTTWARSALSAVDATKVAMAPDLLRELGEKGETPELLAVVGMPADDLDRIPVGPHLLTVVLDRPSLPGNVGTVVRAADAFGAAGVIVTGHAADPYDPRAVRASTGSLFSVPVVRLPGHKPVLPWLNQLAEDGLHVQVLALDEAGAVDIADHDLRGPLLVVVGNEATGLSAAWRQLSAGLARIPITGAASSLNAANAAAVLLYEATRQRRDGTPPQ